MQNQLSRVCTAAFVWMMVYCILPQSRVRVKGTKNNPNCLLWYMWQCCSMTCQALLPLFSFQAKWGRKKIGRTSSFSALLVFWRQGETLTARQHRKRSHGKQVWDVRPAAPEHLFPVVSVSPPVFLPDRGRENSPKQRFCNSAHCSKSGVFLC